MTKFIERHPIKIQVATIITAALFIISVTTWFSHDRDAAFAHIKSNTQTLEMHMRADKELLGALRSLIFDTKRDMIELHKAQQEEIEDQRENIHTNEIVLAEINTKLANVEALLMKLDRKLDDHDRNNQ
jgi:Mg2+ and Co2+ transporter CorA